VVERVPKSQIPDIDKRKFLVPNDITIAQFMWIIRKRIQLAPEKAIFLFVNKTMPLSRLSKKKKENENKIFFLVQQWVKSMLNIKMKIAFYTLIMEAKIHLVKKQNLLKTLN